jgi:O-antigen ligase
MMNSRLANITNSIKLGNWTYIIGILIMVIIPLHVQYLPPFMILWLVVGMLENFLNRAWNVRKDVLWLFIGFILVLSVSFFGLIYDDDRSNGLVQIFRRFSFLIFPLILLFPGTRIKSRVNNLLRVFVYSTCLYIIICFVYALTRSIHILNGIWTFSAHSTEEYWVNYFLGTDFSFSQHPSYLSMYIVLSIFISLEYLFTKSQTLISKMKWSLISLLLLLSIYLLSSRVGIISIIILLPVYLLFKTRGIRNRALIIVFGVSIIAVLLFLFIKGERIQSYVREKAGTPIIERLRTDERMSFWKSATGVIKKNPIFGVGIGSSCEELKKEFKKKGFIQGYYDTLNAHNQYLEELLESGIIGLLVFLGTIGIMVFNAIRNRNLLYGVFIIMMLIFFMFESILNRIAGVTFFALFSFLLLYVTPPTINTKSN